MYKRILVPLDGSAQAEQILPIAVRLAGAWQAILYLVQINDLLAEAETYKMRLNGHFRELVQRHLILDEAYLTRLARRLQFQQIDIRTIVSTGEIVPSLLKISRIYHCDLIVLSSSCAEYHDTQHLGNVAKGLLTESRIPVLIHNEREIISTGMQALPNELVGVA